MKFWLKPHMLLMLQKFIKVFLLQAPRPHGGGTGHKGGGCREIQSDGWRARERVRRENAN
jgi:hypothetical protein